MVQDSHQTSTGRGGAPSTGAAPPAGATSIGAAPPAGATSIGGPPTVGALLAKVTENISALVRDEIQLVQTQLQEKGKAMGLGIGLFVGAGVFGLFMFGWLLTAGMLALALVLPYWAASLIVAGVLLVIAVILALIGRSAMNKAPSPQTGENIKKDVEAVKQGVKS